MMKLPKIDLPLFTTTLPSTGKEVTYRPFTVKEEKILLVAKEASKDSEREEILTNITLAIKQIITNCVHDVNVEELSIFDLEYLLLCIRSKSVSNEAKFTIKDPDTDEEVTLEFDLENVKIIKKEGHTNKIQINNNTWLIMKYPSINEMVKMYGQKDSEAAYDIMINCIDSVVSDDQIYKLKDFSKEEIDEFVENFTEITTREIKKFFATMPVVRHEIPYTRKDGVERTFVVEGLKTFFT